MILPDLYRRLRRYLPVALLTSFGAGGLFGLVVVSLVLLLNRFVHAPAAVNILTYFLSFAYGVLGVVGGLTITLVLVFFFHFLGVTPSKTKFFGLLSTLLLIICSSLLLYHIFQSELYHARFRFFNVSFLLGGEFLLLALIPWFLTVFEGVGERLRPVKEKFPGRLYAGFLMAYLLLPGLLSLVFINTNYSSSYSPLDKTAISRTGKKVILVGWEGANWYVIDKLFKKGLMPNLKRMVEKGTCGTIKSKYPLLSVSLWNTIITGKLVEEHGIKDYDSTYIPYTNLTIQELILPRKLGIDKIYENLGLETGPATGLLRKVPALWEILSIYGYSVVSVGWLSSYPARAVNGFLASDRYADPRYRFEKSKLTNKTKGAYIYPYEYYDRLKENTYGLKDLTREEVRSFMKIGQEDEFLLFGKGKCALDLPVYQFAFDLLTDKGNFEIARRMYRQLKPDFMSVYFGGLDSCQHDYWKYMEPNRMEVDDFEAVERYKDLIPAYYRFLDKQLGKLMKEMDSRSVLMLVSDHGLVSAPGDTGIVGGHSAYGIFACYGYGIPADRRLKTSIYDVVPTILRMLGLPLAEDMKGRPIKELFPEETGGMLADRHTIPTYNSLMRAIRKDRSWEKVVSRSINERIKKMGYKVK